MRIFLKMPNWQPYKKQTGYENVSGLFLLMFDKVPWRFLSELFKIFVEMIEIFITGLKTDFFNADPFFQ